MTAVFLERLADIKRSYPLHIIAQRYNLKLEKQGNVYRACCPFHQERTPSFTIYPDHFCCYGCGVYGDHADLVRKLHDCDLPEAVRILTGESKKAADLPAPVTPAPREDSRANAERAMRTWGEAVHPRGTIVETYLQGRLRRDRLFYDHIAAIATPKADNVVWPACIRFHPACPRGSSGERVPAMICLMVDAQGNPTAGIHRTFLNPDGTSISHGPRKLTLGPLGTIRLSEQCSDGLALAEGVETALAVTHRLGWGPCWAATSAVMLAKLPVMPGITLHLFVDLDDEGTGIEKAEECAERWCAAGRRVYMHLPPSGKDWLDATVDDMERIDAEVAQ